MTTQILEYDFPLNTNEMEKDIDSYVNNGYIYLSSILIPEYSVGNSTYPQQLIIVLHKYQTNTFNIWGDV